MTWDILADIKLRKLEYRMRNCDELRLTVIDTVKTFTARHEKEPWVDDVRGLATLILVEAVAVLEEAVHIGIELHLLPVPDNKETQETILRIAKHCTFLVEHVTPIRNTLTWVIEAEDNQNGATDPA